MDSQLQTRIRDAENRWLVKLRDSCRQIFSGVFLPSHDEIHHSRVWFHARSLLELIQKGGSQLDDGIPEELILSVFFHDTGLSRAPGERHGKESLNLFDEYRKKNRDLFGHLANTSIQRIRHAIEQHDDKTLTSDPVTPDFSPDLLTILSSADDLDAFGLMGIYRYAEIYMLRGIKPVELPAKVCTNVRNRFENLEKKFASFPGFLADQRPRYLQVYEFYLKLGEVLPGIDEKPSWEPQLIWTIYDGLLKGRNLMAPGRELPETGYEEINRWFELLDLEVKIMYPEVGR